MVKKNSIEALINEALAGMLSILNDDEKRLIIENFHIQTYKKNEMIYNEGEKAELLMCLIKGKVKIFKAGIGGRCQIMRLIRPIQYFGYRAYFAGEDKNISEAVSPNHCSCSKTTTVWKKTASH